MLKPWRVVARSALVSVAIVIALACVMVILINFDANGLDTSDIIGVFISGAYIGIVEAVIVTTVVALIARWRRPEETPDTSVGRIIGLTIVGFLGGLLCIPIAFLPAIIILLADIQAWHGPIFLSPIVCPVFGGIIGGMHSWIQIYVEEGRTPRILTLSALLIAIMAFGISLLFIRASIAEKANQAQATPFTLPPTWTMTPAIAPTPTNTPTP